MFPKYPHLLKVLRNIWLCSFYRLTGKLKYPNSILPKTCFKNFLEFDTLIENQQIFLLRRSDKPLEHTFSILGGNYILCQDAIEDSDLLDLSLNLLGGKFQIKHIKFIPKIKSEACYPWDGKSSIYLSDHLHNYSVVEVPCYIFIDSSNIHNETISYSRTQDKPLDKHLKSLGKTFKPENKIYNFESRVKFVAVPTNINYWHFELRINEFDNDPISNKKPAWVKALCHQIFNDIISVNTSPLVPSYSKIPLSYYKK